MALDLGDAEVQDLHAAGVADEDVRRADVAVHQAQGLAVEPDGVVGVGQPLADVVHDVERGGQLQRVAQPVEHRVEAATVNVLHRDEVAPVVLAELVDVHHVGVVDERRHASLVEERLDELRVSGEVGADALDHQLLGEARDPRLLRQKHLAHPALGEAAQQDVAPELFRFHRPMVRYNDPKGATLRTRVGGLLWPGARRLAVSFVASDNNMLRVRGQAASSGSPAPRPGRTSETRPPDPSA